MHSVAHPAIIWADSPSKTNEYLKLSSHMGEKLFPGKLL